MTLCSSASPSQTWRTDFEGDVFYYNVCGEDGVKKRVEKQFYIDPERKVATFMLRWAAQVSRRFSCKGTTPQRPLVISGLPKVCGTTRLTLLCFGAKLLFQTRAGCSMSGLLLPESLLRQLIALAGKARFSIASRAHCGAKYLPQA